MSTTSSSFQLNNGRLSSSSEESLKELRRAGRIHLYTDRDMPKYPPRRISSRRHSQGPVQIPISRDFVLLCGLCLGLACAMILILRPAILTSWIFKS